MKRRFYWRGYVRGWFVWGTFDVPTENPRRFGWRPVLWCRGYNPRSAERQPDWRSGL